MSDRTVHATHYGDEIVRYRAGKWYVERLDGGRTHIGVRHAARLATNASQTGHGEINWGQPGGTSFDHCCRRLLQEGSA